MTLQDQLMADLRDAMRSKDAPRRSAIRMVRAAVKNAEIDWQREATDEEVIAIIAGEVKRRREALGLFRQAGRDDLVNEEEMGLAILEAYLPRQLEREEIEPAVAQIIAEIGATDMSQLGSVMRQAMSQLKGKADGKLVNQIAREILSR